MTTVADLVQDTHRELYGTYRPEYARLGSAVDDSQTSLALTTSVPVTESTLLSIDSELILVWGTSGTTYEVQRAMLGTEAAAHDGDTLVEVNPRFPSFAIRDALQKEILSWEPRVFRVDTTTASIVSGDRAVEMSGNGDIIDVLKVTRSARTGQDSKFELGFRYERELDALYLDSCLNEAADLNITFSLPIDVSTFELDTVLEDDCGMSPTQFDIATLGAAWRLVISREIKRNFMEAQGEPRSSQEVPPGAIANSGRVMKALRDERLREEMQRLRTRYPFRRR
jgi:hypothetical protein